jgi:hypothetical protein
MTAAAKLPRLIRSGLAVLGALALSSVALALSSAARAQPPERPAEPPRQAAPIDLTGQWVSIVNEDWRWRMVTPPKGDATSVPLNAEGLRVANSWDPAEDGACEAYGAAGLMRMPMRLRIRWDGDSVLEVQTDAGRQTRRLSFDPVPAGPRSLQGRSAAEWVRSLRLRGRRGPVPGAPPPKGGYLKVTTTDLLPGWLRRNGVPYSEDTVLTEYFDRFQAPNGDEWLMVTSIVDDPKYLRTHFVTSSHFKRETDPAKWNPQPCGVKR